MTQVSSYVFRKTIHSRLGPRADDIFHIRGDNFKQFVNGTDGKLHGEATKTNSDHVGAVIGVSDGSWNSVEVGVDDHLTKTNTQGGAEVLYPSRSFQVTIGIPGLETAKPSPFQTGAERS